MISVTWTAAADPKIPLDHFGPDPMQSENCLLVVPGHSVLCRGKFDADDIPGNTTIIFSCVPGIYLILTHESHPDTQQFGGLSREIEFAGLKLNWLAVSEFQSALYIESLYRDQDYHRPSLFDVLVDLSVRRKSSIEYSLKFQSGAEHHTRGGTFEFGISDAFMLLSVIDRCQV